MSIAVGVVLAVAGCGGANRPTGLGQPGGQPTDSPSAGPGPSATVTAAPSSSPTRSASTGLIAFFQLRTIESGASEVTTPAQLDRFLAGVPEADRRVRDAVAHTDRAGQRLF